MFCHLCISDKEQLVVSKIFTLYSLVLKSFDIQYQLLTLVSEIFISFYFGFVLHYHYYYTMIVDIKSETNTFNTSLRPQSYHNRVLMQVHLKVLLNGDCTRLNDYNTKTDNIQGYA